MASISANKSARLMERSVYSERICFLETLKSMGGISQPEFNIAASWFEVMTANLGEKIKPDLIGTLLIL